jgi:hypothetical protein
MKRLTVSLSEYLTTSPTPLDFRPAHTNQVAANCVAERRPGENAVFTVP